MIMAEAIFAALVVSSFTGGSIKHLAAVPLKGERILLVLLPAQLIWPTLAERLGLGCGASLLVWLLMMAGLAMVLMSNAGQQWALAIAALGIAANVLVIGLNQAMPVSIRAASEIGGTRTEARTALADDCLHEELNGDTLLPFLGDIIAIPGPKWQRAVVSLGDVTLCLGLFVWIVLAAREGRE